MPTGVEGLGVDHTACVCGGDKRVTIKVGKHTQDCGMRAPWLRKEVIRLHRTRGLHTSGDCMEPLPSHFYVSVGNTSSGPHVFSSTPSASFPPPHALQQSHFAK